MAIKYTAPELEMIQNSAKEMSDSMTRAQAEKDLQKDIVANLKDTLELKPAEFNKIVRTYHDQSLQEQEDKWTEFTDLYIDVFKPGA